MHEKAKAIEECGDTPYTCGGDVEFALIKVTRYTKVSPVRPRYTSRMVMQA